MPMTSETDKGLSACPFCACLATLECHGSIFEGAPGYRVECAGKCHAMTCYWHTAEEALAAWNTRTPPTQSGRFAVTASQPRSASMRETERHRRNADLLASAIRPFADMHFDNNLDPMSYSDGIIMRCEVTVGEIRAARNALRETGYVD